MKDTREIKEEITRSVFFKAGYKKAEERFLKKQDLFVKELKEELRTNVLETEINGVRLILKCVKTMDKEIEKLKIKHFGEELKKGGLE